MGDKELIFLILLNAAWSLSLYLRERKFKKLCNNAIKAIDEAMKKIGESLNGIVTKVNND